MSPITKTFHSQHYNKPIFSYTSYERLEKLLIFVKNGNTVLSKVMDLILTILCCILLKTDHQIYINEFMDSFDERNLQALRSDLENLLHFDQKLFNYMILQFANQAIQSETDHCKKTMKINPRRLSKVIFRRKVRFIVKFLIFRKVTNTESSHTASDIMNWASYKRQIGLIAQNYINLPNNFLFETRNRFFASREFACYDDIKLQNFPEFEKIKYYDNRTYVCMGHSSKSVSFYKWLWLILFYCCLFFYPIAVNIASKLTYKIIFQ